MKSKRVHLILRLQSMFKTATEYSRLQYAYNEMAKDRDGWKERALDAEERVDELHTETAIMRSHFRQTQQVRRRCNSKLVNKGLGYRG